MPSKMKRGVDVVCLCILALCVVDVVRSSLDESKSTLVTYSDNTSSHMQHYCMCKTSMNFTGESTEVCCYFLKRPSYLDHSVTDTEESYSCDQSTEYSEAQPLNIVCVDVEYMCTLQASLTETEVLGNFQKVDDRFTTINKTLTVMLEQYRDECSQCMSKISRVGMKFTSKIIDLESLINDLNATFNTTIFIETDNLQKQLASLWQMFYANVSLVNSTLYSTMNELKRIDETLNDFFYRVNENEKKLQKEKFDSIEKQNEINMSVDRRISSLNDTVTQIPNTLREIIKTQQRLNHSLIAVLFEMKGRFLEVRARIKHMYFRLSSKNMHTLLMLNSTKSEFDHVIFLLNSSFNASLASIENRLEDFKNTLTKTLNEQTKSIHEKLEKEISALKQDIDSDRRELSSQKQLLEIENKILTQRIFQLEERFNENVALIFKNVNSHKAIIDVIYPNTFDKGAFVLVIMTLFVWMIVMTIAYCRLRSKLNKELQDGQVTLRKDVNFTRALHDGSLEKKLGIVYFNPSTKEIISKVLQQLRRRLPQEFQDRVLASDDDWVHVKNHETGRDLPNTKMCFLCAEFHERHVIIEEPGLGLGDLKRKTLEALYDAGVTIVIVYVRHSGSKQLKEDRLYHEEIHCALHQPELKVFSDAGRFFSIYDTCSPYQAQTLCAILQDNLS